MKANRILIAAAISLLIVPLLLTPAEGQEAIEIRERIEGKSAYLPYKIVIRFPRPEAPINVTISAVAMSPQRTTQTFESIIFETDQVDTFTIQFTLVYRTPPFSPIVMESFSGGASSGSKQVPLVMPTAKVTLTISTSKEPHNPTVEEIWEYQYKKQLETQRIKEAEERDRWERLMALATTLEYLLYIDTLVLAVVLIFTLSGYRR